MQTSVGDIMRTFWLVGGLVAISAAGVIVARTVLAWVRGQYSVPGLLGGFLAGIGGLLLGATVAARVRGPAVDPWVQLAVGLLFVAGLLLQARARSSSDK